MDRVVARLEVVGLVLKIFDPLNGINRDRCTVDPLDEIENYLGGLKGVYNDGKDFVFAHDVGCRQELLTDVYKVSYQSIVPRDLLVFNLLQGMEQAWRK